MSTKLFDSKKRQITHFVLLVATWKTLFKLLHPKLMFNFINFMSKR